MMVLYSGTTDPYSHRCRFVLFEKGMDFEIRDVDLFAKPEDIALMNPYNEVPILVERDLILYESHIINEYIDERFPHPQLMPGDPVARARVRLFLFNFEKELFAHVNMLESRGMKGTDKQLEKARSQIRDRLTQLAPIFLKKVHAGRRLLDARRGDRAAAVAAGLLRYRHVEERRAVAQVRRAHLFAPGIHRGADPVREGDAQVVLPCYIAAHEQSNEFATDRPNHRWNVDPAVPDSCASRLVHRQWIYALHRGVR